MLDIKVPKSRLRGSPMLSSTAEYALRAVVYLASEPADSRTSQEIAQVTRVPAGYVSKVLQALVRAGLAHSQRGPSGGFTLARAPAGVSALEVINAVDPIKRIRECPLGLPSHGENLCRLHRRVDDAIASVEKVFAETTIAELMEQTTSGTRCLFPTLENRPAKKAPK